MKQRPLLTAIIALFAVFFLMVLGLYLYLTPDRLRALIVPRIEEALQRRVQLDDIGLSLWGGLSASIDGLRIEDREGFGSDPFLESRHAGVSIPLFSLLTSEPELGTIRIEKPGISIVVNEKGEANYEDLIKSEPKESEKSGVSAPVLPIERLEVINGSMRQEDRRTGIVTRLGKIDYRLDIALEGDALKLNGRASIADIVTIDPGGGESSAAGFSLSHRISFHPKTDEITVESVRVSSGPLEIEMNGMIRNVSGVPDLSLELRNAKDALEWTSPDGVVADGKISASASLNGPFAPEASPPAFPDLTGSIAVTDLTVKTPDLLVPLEHGIIRIRAAENVLSIEELRAEAGRSDLSGTGRLSGLSEVIFADGRPFLSFTLNSNLLDFDEMLPADPPKSTARLHRDEWSLTVPAYAESYTDETSPLLLLVRDIDASGSIAAKEVKSGAVLRDLKAKVTAKNRRLSLKDITGRIYGGVLTGKIDVDARKPHGALPVRADLKLSGSNSDGVLKNFFGLPLPLQGSMSLAMKMTGVVDSTLTLIEKEISADGTAGVAEGKIVSWTWLKDNASGISQLSFLDFDEIPIKALKTSFRVSDERVYLQKLTLTAADIPCRINGSAGFDNSLDLTIDMDLPAHHLNVGGLNIGQVLGSFFGEKSPSGTTIPVRIHFGGTTDKPDVTLDLKTQAKKRTRRKAEGLLKKLW